jgi:hypothetical protein
MVLVRERPLTATCKGVRRGDCNKRVIAASISLQPRSNCSKRVIAAAQRLQQACRRGTRNSGSKTRGSAPTYSLTNAVRGPA